METWFCMTNIHNKQSIFFQNEVIFIQLNELDKLDMTHAWIGFNNSLTLAQDILV